MKIHKKMKKMFLIVLSIFMLIPCNTSVFATSEEEQNGFKISLNWNRSSNPTSYEWNSSTNESRVVRLNVGYSNNSVDKGYQAGELKITVPGIGSANRTSVIGASDIAADRENATEKERDWSYTYDSDTDTYTFTNNYEIEEKSNFSGSFEILWQFGSRSTINDYSKTLQATLTDGTYSYLSNEVSFKFTSQKDVYSLTEKAQSLSSPDGLGDGYKNYIWVNWLITPSVITKARGVSGLYYEITTPEDVVVKFADTNFVKTGEGIYKLGYRNYTMKVTIGYPKDKYNGVEISNPVNLIGKYDDETQQSVLAQANASTILNSKDYDFVYTGNIVSINKNSTTAHFDYEKTIETGEQSSYSLRFGINNNQGIVYNMAVYDDIIDVKLKDGTFRRLNDNEYSFKSVIIPSSNTITNGNGQSIEADKYDCEIYVRYAGTQEFVLFKDELKVKTDSQYFSLPDNVVGVKFLIKGIDVSVKGEFAVTINYHLIDENSIIDQQGFIRNLDAIDLLDSENNVLNSVDETTYTGSWAEQVAQRDINIYGRYMQRSYKDIPFRKDGEAVTISSSVNISKIIATDKTFNSSMSLKTFFDRTGNGIKKLTKFSQYTILDEGLKVNIDNFDFTLVCSGFTFANGQTVSNEWIKDHLNVDIIKNYKNSGRIYIKFDYDFSDMPVYVSDTRAQVNFPVYITSDDYLEFGETYNGKMVTKVHQSDLLIYTENSCSDNGEYFNSEKQLWSDIDNDGDISNIVSYNSTYTSILQAISSYQELQKSVKSDYTDDEYVTKDALTLLDDSYSYKVKFRTGNSLAENVVIYDDLETAEGSQWKGTFDSIDLSYLNKAGYEPKVWYSTIDNAGSLSNTDNWTLTQPDKNKIKSIAIDFGKTTIADNSLLYYIVNMTSPSKNTYIDKKAINEFRVEGTSLDRITGLETGSIDLLSNAVEVGLSEPIGDVTVIKKDDVTGNKLSGAVFTLYDSNDKVVKDDLKTNSLGKIVISNVKFGDYYLKEKTAPEGYSLSSEKINVTINKKEIEVNITNERIKGKVSLKKVSSKNENLFVKGAKYSLYKVGSDGDTLIKDDILTGNDGKTNIIENLEWGAYYFVEKEATLGFELNPNRIDFFISRYNAEEGLEVNTTDVPKPAKVILIKEEVLEDGTTKSGALVSEAHYDLYDSQDKLIKENLITDSNGQIVVDELEYGDYYFKETKATGYILNENKIEFSLNPNSEETNFDDNGMLVNTIYTDNVRKTGKIALIKVSDDGLSLKNAMFALYDEYDIVVKEGLTTNDEGQIMIDDLKWGSYYLKETKAPAGHILDETHYEFTVDRNSVESTSIIKIENEKYKGKVILTKVDANETSTVLANAKYTLYSNNGTIIKDDLVTNRDGQIAVDELEWGSYYFLEKEAPEGYSLSSEKIRFSVNSANASVTQKLVAKDSLEDACDITITKEISKDKVWFAHGNPTFIYKITGTDISGNNHTYYENIVFDENYVENNTVDGKIRQSTSLIDLPAGNYIVEEMDVLRYEIENIIEITNGTKNSNDTVSFSLSSMNKSGSVIFINDKTKDNDYSHNDSVDNIIKSSAVVTGLSVDSSIEIQKTETIDRDKLVVTAIYDDGTTKILGNDEYTLDPEILDSSMNGEYTINASYTEKGITVNESFTIMIKLLLPFKGYLYYVDRTKSETGSGGIRVGTYNPEKGVTITNSKYTPNEIWINEYTGTSTVVDFPETIEGYNVVLGSGASIINGLTNVTSINISEGIKYINSRSFEGCNKLSGTLKLPNSIINFGSGTFKNCTNITSIIFPDNLKKIYYEAFSGCTGLTGNLIIPDSVTFIGDYAFRNCTGLNGTLTIGKNVTSIGNNSFQNCNFIGNLIIPDSVTSIGNQAFIDCSNFNGNLIFGKNVTSIGSMAFAYCSGFTGDLIIPNSVTTINSSAFKNCTGFNGTLTIGKNVTSIGSSAFSNCSGLTGNLVIPDSVTTIGKEVFFICSGLNGTLTIGKNVTSIGKNAFYSCTGLTGDLIIPDSVTSIGDSAFLGCTGLNGNLVIPNSITSIGDHTFDRCTGLKGDLIIPDSVTSIGDYAFYSCTGLNNTLTIGKNVTSIGRYSFQACKFKGDLVIPDSVTSIGDSAFYSCTGFTGNLMIPDSVTTIGKYAFYNCKGLNGTLTIGENVISIGDYAFSMCSGLTGNVILSSSVSSIGNYAFNSCTGLTSIRIFNPECTIYDSINTIDGAINIYGWKGSTAQTYAEKYNKTFIALDDSLTKFNISLADDSKDLVASPESSFYEMMKVKLTPVKGKIVSFKINGLLIKGDTFTMPSEDVVISDVIVVVPESIVIESEHNPYPNSMNNKVYGEKTFEYAKSLTIVLEYQTESTNYDWIYLYDKNGSIVNNKKYGGTTRKTETITVSGDTIKIVFRTDSSGNNYYGFKATITPNYD